MESESDDWVFSFSPVSSIIFTDIKPYGVGHGITLVRLWRILIPSSRRYLSRPSVTNVLSQYTHRPTQMYVGSEKNGYYGAT